MEQRCPVTLRPLLCASSMAAQFFGRDVHVSFKPGDALRCGYVHGAASFVRVCERMHLRKNHRLAFEIGCGEYDFRAAGGPSPRAVDGDVARRSMLPVVRIVVTPEARYKSGNETGCSTRRRFEGRLSGEVVNRSHAA